MQLSEKFIEVKFMHALNWSKHITVCSRFTEKTGHEHNCLVRLQKTASAIMTDNIWSVNNVKDVGPAFVKLWPGLPPHALAQRLNLCDVMFSVPCVNAEQNG